MRLALLPLLLLAATACSRSHAPSQAASAKPGPDAAIAQSVPAGGAPAPAASVAEAAPVAVDAATGQPVLPPDKSEAPPDKSDTRWRDVDPNTLGGRDENALAKFQAEQRKRDAELMAQDADEANSRVARAAPHEDEAPDRRYADARDDRRYEEERYADPRYADRRDDPRYDERDYGADPYGDLPPDEGPWDNEGAYDEPPYDEAEYPPPDEDYDPRYDPGYDPRYDRPYR